MILAAFRPDSADLPLLLHVAGALLLVGAMVAATACLLLAWRARDPGDTAGLTRLGWRTILYGVLPSFILMRGAGQWVASEEGLDGEDVSLDWLDIGFLVGDGGLLLLVITMILVGITARRQGRTPGRLGIGGRIGTVLAVILLAALLLAVWAMSAKPI
ncbi:MAG: hypothetical protein QOJ13_3648 [Gaiellales bacterium]|jgi:hypothetical protein|nr:hypothetical protein [Gaiellales bacterium]